MTLAALLGPALFAAAAAPSPSAFPACAPGSVPDIVLPPNAVVFDPKSVETFLAGNRDGYSYFTLAVTNGKVDVTIPESSYVDNKMRDALIEAGHAIYFAVEGQPCTPSGTSSTLVKFYSNGQLQIGPDKRAKSR